MSIPLYDELINLSWTRTTDWMTHPAMKMTIARMMSKEQSTASLGTSSSKDPRSLTAEALHMAATETPSPLTTERVEYIDGVVIGVLLGFDDAGEPLVAFPGNPEETALQARSTAQLADADIGREVALLFEGGDPRSPLVIGLVQHPARNRSAPEAVHADIDDERILLRADREIVLKCGKASITLTREGKVLIRGAYLLSRSSGVNRIKGGSVQVN
jgi:hypothetical protein